MPLSIAYQLSSKKIDFDEKVNFVKKNHKKAFRELKLDLKTNFPTSYKPKDVTKHYLKTSLSFLKKANSKNEISKASKAVILEMKTLIDKFL
jgi:hypothetical protein